MMFFFFNDTATTEIYTLSLHDALPIYRHRRRVGLARSVRDGVIERVGAGEAGERVVGKRAVGRHHDVAVVDGSSRAGGGQPRDRKSTRLNSSHANISYAVFCLKKKKQ